MANTLYDNARKLFLEGQLDWMNNTIQAVLVDTANYTPSFSGHVHLADIPPAARNSPGFGPVTLSTGKNTAGGAADADDITFTSVSGPSVEAIVLFRWVSSPTDSPLIAFIDTGTGLPITPNGGDIIVTWDSGPNKIFKV
jgi:hypothetical protein